MEVKGKVEAKYKDNRALKLDDGKWYNLAEIVKSYADKIVKGDEVTLTYEKKGTALTVTNLVKGIEAQKGEESKVETPKTEPEPSIPPEDPKPGYKFACSDCGKELKDGRFKKCFVCNKKNPTPRTEKKSSYDNPEKTAQIQRGNALNAAGFVASNQQFADPEEAIQYTLEVAERFLEWLRIE